MLKRNRVRKTKDTTAEVSASLDAWSQLRRCHRCGSTHESKIDRVLKCANCKAHFAPYFFAELTPESLSEMCVKAKPASLVLSSAKRYRPVIGITWWWNDGDSPSGEVAMPRA